MKRLVFSPLDILAPWAICLVSAGFCVLAAVKAPTAPGRYISLAVGAFFLVGIGLWYFVRAGRRTPKFETLTGLGVVWGQKNKPSKELVDVWVRDLTSFWLGRIVTFSHAGVARTITQSILEKALAGLTVICYDTDHFSFWGRMVTGYAFGRDVAVGFKGMDMNYTSSLFHHEVSHQILDAAGVPWDEAQHHKIFKDAGLGA